MILGLDYYRTITSSPRFYRKLSTALLAQGFLVYIITAVRSENVALVKDSVKRSKVPHTGLEVVVFKDFDDIPQLKLLTCKRLGVKLMLDDNPATCSLLREHRIIAGQV